MALTGNMDITLIENFKTLPCELRNIVFSYINIDKLVSYDDKELKPLIDAYIKHYINTRLFTDASIFTFMRNTKLYGKIIDDKINNMATIWAKDFMEQSKMLNEKPVAEMSHWNIFFNVKYNRRSVEYRSELVNNTPFKTSIHYRPTILKNNLIIIRNTSIVQGIAMNMPDIISEMTDSLCYCMNMLFSGVYKVHSIELVKTYSSTGIDNSDSGESQNIKKYY